MTLHYITFVTGTGHTKKMLKYFKCLNIIFEYLHNIEMSKDDVIYICSCLNVS